jgi:hypothetical protein
MPTNLDPTTVSLIPHLSSPYVFTGQLSSLLPHFILAQSLAVPGTLVDAELPPAQSFPHVPSPPPPPPPPAPKVKMSLKDFAMWERKETLQRGVGVPRCCLQNVKFTVAIQFRDLAVKWGGGHDRCSVYLVSYAFLSQGKEDVIGMALSVYLSCCP